MQFKPWISGLLFPQVKTARAGMHLDELKAQCGLFSKNPYTVTEHDDAKFHIVTVILNEADPIIPILVGEFAYALRSGLDHLAWQLGLLSGRTPTRSSCFPIHSSDSRKDRERFLNATWNIPCEAIEIIKTFQPYLRGKDMKSDPLWQLNKLCNLDKHMTIGHSSTETRIRVFAPEGIPQPAVIPRDETGRTFVLIPIAHKAHIKVKLEPPAQIFGKPIDLPGAGFELTEEEITEIHRFVRDEVLPPFARFFPMGSSLSPSVRDGKPV